MILLNITNDSESIFNDAENSFGLAVWSIRVCYDVVQFNAVLFTVLFILGHECTITINDYPLESSKKKYKCCKADSWLFLVACFNKTIWKRHQPYKDVFFFRSTQFPRDIYVNCLCCAWSTFHSFTNHAIVYEAANFWAQFVRPKVFFVVIIYDTPLVALWYRF